MGAEKVVFCLFSYILLRCEDKLYSERRGKICVLRPKLLRNLLSFYLQKLSNILFTICYPVTCKDSRHFLLTVRYLICKNSVTSCLQSRRHV